jgi:DNA relaxase NicK
MYNKYNTHFHFWFFSGTRKEITIKVKGTNCRKRLLKTSAINGSEQKIAAGGCFIRLVCV